MGSGIGLRVEFTYIRRKEILTMGVILFIGLVCWILYAIEGGAKLDARAIKEATK